MSMVSIEKVSDAKATGSESRTFMPDRSSDSIVNE